MTHKKLNRILFMGCYDVNFRRSTMFLLGLKRNNIQVYEYNVPSHSIIINIKSFFFSKNYKKLKKLDFDLILLHSEAFIQLILAK